MPRGPLYDDSYRPQLSGHETFPMRYGWLKKAFDAVHESENIVENKFVFLGDDAIARFGVGKNMVSSMRHWANVTGVIAESANSPSISTTALGRKLFGARGMDPFMENPATLWLIHWQLAARPDKTTWFWAFNHYPFLNFAREHIAKGLERLARERNWSRVAGVTIKNDVNCFVRTYVAKLPSAQEGHEDTLESPLTELGLIAAVDRRDAFRFVRGPRTTLGAGVFTYALLDFWSRHSGAMTLSFETIAHEPGGPGRVFLLDENEIMDRLGGLEETTHGLVQWSETAGLKQLVRDKNLDLQESFRFIDIDYGVQTTRKAF